MMRSPKRTLLGIALGAGLVLTGACAQEAPTEQKTETKTDAKTETKTAASPAASPATKTAASPAAKTAASPRAASPSPSPSPVTTLPFDQPDQLTALVGRPVRLTDVEVQSVPGDEAFWVGPSETERLFVFLAEDQTPPGKTESKVEVNAGDQVDIRGELRRMPSEQEAQQLFDLPQDELQAVTDAMVYIHAESVEPAS